MSRKYHQDFHSVVVASGTQDNPLLLEGIVRKMSDGSLFMLWTTDVGITWSEPKQTDIPSAITKVLLLRNKSGAVYLVHNPNPTGRRSPLALWISYDGMKTWKDKIILAEDDNAPLCYPDGFLDEESGKLCLSWDDRSHIYYSEFKL